MRAGLRYLRQELFSHLPFSIFATVGGMALVAVLTFLGEPFYKENLPGAFRELFHIFHPAHMLFSAAATTAMFWQYERRWLKALVVGLLGAILLCGASDILIPYASGLVLGAKMHPHLCIIEHPALVLPFALIGVAAGFLSSDHIVGATFFSHAAHVLVSSAASLLYLVSFGLERWIDAAGWVFIVVVLAVTIPCCFSDIVFPLLAVGRDGGTPPHGHHH
ncbi:MAG: hypothetical protein AMS14_00735 [Planctomycetes bacterium DG_20]|nr:MAG: hypothetical protein AMS14_00735 [Planctomycetes bacterium DG_20]